MSVYNTPDDWLFQSIQSVLDQSYSEFEFLIVDDRTSQSNKDILKFYREKDSRIHILKNEHNEGLTKSLNKALAAAKGDFIARLDSDDIALPQRFEKQLEQFMANEKLVLCGTWATTINGEKKGSCKTLVGTSDYLKINLLFGNIFVHSSVMIRSSILKKNNLMYDENFKAAQDFELWSRLAQYGDIKNIDEIHCVYRIHEKQISTKQIDLQNSYRDEIIQKNLAKIGLIISKQNISRYINVIHAKGEKEKVWWIFVHSFKIMIMLFMHYGIKAVQINKYILWNSALMIKKQIYFFLKPIMQQHSYANHNHRCK